MPLVPLKLPLYQALANRHLVLHLVHLERVHCVQVLEQVLVSFPVVLKQGNLEY
jgi:hypothetical protein